MHSRRNRQNDIFGGRGRRGPGYRVRRARFVRRMLAVLAIPLGVVVLIAGFTTFKGILEPDANALTILGIGGEPVTGAVVTAENGRQATSVEGGTAFLVFDTPAMLDVTADGYKPATFAVDAVPVDSPLNLQLEPRVLNGRVTDHVDNGVVGAEVIAGDKRTISGEFGNFEIVGAAPGEVLVSKSSWDDVSFIWDGDEGRIDVSIEPFIVRGLRVYGYEAHDDAFFDRLLGIADTTAINTLVFDTKNEYGEILYLSRDQDAFESEAILNKYDVEKRLQQAKDHGLYTITRIVTFQDHFMALYKPEHAIMDSATGQPWQNWGRIEWLDPTDLDAWEYPINLGLEACRLGFDEIQFDYVRFPTDGDTSTTVYDDPTAVESAASRVEAISSFLAEARRRINAAGCAVSADLFAIVMSVEDDQGIGQRVEELSSAVDVISPMIYPSHYSNGWLGLDDPNDHPAEVVEEALSSGVSRADGGALVRPWLQAFSWTADQVRESVMTAEQYTAGWMLWNSQSIYEPDYVPAGLE